MGVARVCRAARRGCRRIANGPLHRVRVGRSGQAGLGFSQCIPPGRRARRRRPLALPCGSRQSAVRGADQLPLSAATRSRDHSPHSNVGRRRSRDRRAHLPGGAHGGAGCARSSRRSLLCRRRHLGAGLECRRDGQRLGIAGPARCRGLAVPRQALATRGDARRGDLDEALSLAVARVGAGHAPRRPLLARWFFSERR